MNRAQPSICHRLFLAWALRGMPTWRRACVASHLSRLAGVLLAVPAGAYGADLPSDGTVVSGAGSIHGAGTQLTIQQDSARLAIDWRSFDIGEGHRVIFQQPDASSIALNRVTGGDASQIHGALQANGRVFLVNPHGILFGSGAQVDVGGLVASSLDLSVRDFESGRYRFQADGQPGAVINQGTLRASDRGVVALLGATVSNQGLLAARQGSVALASGKAVTLDFAGDGLLNVQVDQAIAGALAENKQWMQAEGGVVWMTAAAADAALRTVVNNGGLVDVSGIDAQGGVVRLVGQGGNTLHTGAILAAGERGGQVQLLSDQAVSVTGHVDATGRDGGGRIRVGGGYRGGEGLAEATSVLVGSQAVLDASATGHGDGGSVVVWARDNSAVHGSLHADGGIAGGDGGLIETSGRQIDVGGIHVSARARAQGHRAGTWLMDPQDLVIDDALAGQIVQALDGGTGYEAVSTGDLTLASGITWHADTTLTLSADGNLVIAQPIIAHGAAAGLALNYGGTDGNASTTPFEGTDYFPYQPITLHGEQASLRVNGHDYTLIRDVPGLLAINDDLSGRYALAQTIDLQNVLYTHALIGSAVKPFTGEFAGLGNTVSGLRIQGTELATGLFSAVTDGILRNVRLHQFDVRSSQQFVGALAGNTLRARIQDVALQSGSVQGSARYTGGLIGRAYASLISNIVSDATVQAADYYAGGLIGTLRDSVLASSHGAGTVDSSAEFYAYAGGLVGDSLNSVLLDVSASGDVTGKANHLGGLVGRMHSGGSIQYSYATGNVSSSGIYTAGHYVGGLVGQNNGGDIINAYASGNVQGQNSVGGLVGGHHDGQILHAYATGNVSGNLHVGGLVGDSYGTNAAASIDHAYATGRVTGAAQSAATGGLVGVLDGESTVSSSFFAVTDPQGNPLNAGMSVVGEIRNTASIDGVSAGKRWQEMQSGDLFADAGWDIDGHGCSCSVWRIYDGHTMPLLRSFLTPALVEVLPDALAGKVYDGVAAEGAAAYAADGVIWPERILGQVAFATSGANVGTYRLQDGSLTLRNDLYSSQQGYDITLVMPHDSSVTILPRPLSIVADDVVKTQGETAALTRYHVSGLLDMDAVLSLSLESAGAGPAAAPGTYAIVAGNAGGLGLENYTIAYGQGVLTVRPAQDPEPGPGPGPQPAPVPPPSPEPDLAVYRSAVASAQRAPHGSQRQDQDTVLPLTQIIATGIRLP